MKKTIIILLSIFVLILSCTGCGSNSKNSADSKLDQQLKEQYPFYEESVKLLAKKMDISIVNATEVFKLLVSVGMDKKVNYCYDYKGYYKVYWGLKSVDVYLKEGKVVKIMRVNTELYPSTPPPPTPTPVATAIVTPLPDDTDLTVSDDSIWLGKEYEDATDDLSDIKWKDIQRYGIVNVMIKKSDDQDTVEKYYYKEVANYLHGLNRGALKDYSYIEFQGIMKVDGRKKCVIKGRLSISYIKNNDSISANDVKRKIKQLEIYKSLK